MAARIYKKRTIGIWDVQSGMLIRELPTHFSRYDRPSLALGWTGRICISTNAAKVSMWDVDNSAEIGAFTAESEILSVAIASREQVVVCGDEHGLVHFLKLEGISQC